MQCCFAKRILRQERTKDKARELKYAGKRATRRGMDRVAFPVPARAHVPEFTLARWTCLSILDRKLKKEASRKVRPSEGQEERRRNKSAVRTTAIRLIEIQVLPPFDLAVWNIAGVRSRSSTTLSLIEIINYRDWYRWSKFLASSHSPRVHKSRQTCWNFARSAIKYANTTK